MTGENQSRTFATRARALLIAEGLDCAHAGSAALTAMGVDILGPFEAVEGSAQLQAEVGVDMILIEASEASADALDATLAAAEAIDVPGGPAIIVALTEQQIDEVAARLLSGRVQLLCAPDLRERVTAIAVALASRGRSFVRADDRDEDRRRRLNEEIARIAETLARLTGDIRDMGSGDSVKDRTVAYRSGDGAAAVTVRAAEVRQAIRIRRLREQFFGEGLFEDPAWDMLLDLFAAELERTRVSVSSLCIAAAVAPTTALRWIGRMTEAGLFQREPDPFDRRRAYMVLSPRAREGMRGYCAAVKRMGGVIG